MGQCIINEFFFALQWLAVVCVEGRSVQIGRNRVGGKFN